MTTLLSVILLIYTNMIYFQYGLFMGTRAYSNFIAKDLFSAILWPYHIVRLRLLRRKLIKSSVWKFDTEFYSNCTLMYLYINESKIVEVHKITLGQFGKTF